MRGERAEGSSAACAPAKYDDAGAVHITHDVLRSAFRQLRHAVVSHIEIYGVSCFIQLRVSRGLCASLAPTAMRPCRPRAPHAGWRALHTGYGQAPDRRSGPGATPGPAPGRAPGDAAGTAAGTRGGPGGRPGGLTASPPIRDSTADAPIGRATR